MSSEAVEQELIKDPSSELIEPSSEESKEMVEGCIQGDCGGVGSCC